MNTGYRLSSICTQKENEENRKKYKIKVELDLPVVIITDYTLLLFFVNLLEGA